MAVQFLTGKPGGGKTLFAVKLIVKELVNGQRPIVTNVPLKMGELNEYLQKTYPHTDTKVIQRVKILKDEETFYFYRHRGTERDIILDVKGDKIDYETAFKTGPVMYVIDELHVFFNAREWAKTGKAALTYLSQHRHLGDDVICITQSIKNVDRQFRSVAQDFTHLRNYSKEKFWGLRMPSRFVYRTYLSENEGDARQPMVTGTFRLDVAGLASCYDTSAGVGLVGACAADTGSKVKGPSIWWLAVLIILISATLWYLPTMLYSKVQEKVKYQPNNQININQGEQQLIPQEHQQIQDSNKQPEKNIEKEEEVYITGYYTYGKKVKVYLSNGDEVTEKSQGVQLISDKILIRSNIVYKYNQKVPRGTLAGIVPTYPNN